MIKSKKPIKERRKNLFMTDDEAGILWQYSQGWGTKWRVMLGFALFRGMRIGEICAINLYDFQNENFNKLNIILQKSNIKDEFPLLGGFNDLLKEYIATNKHRFKDGYIFPHNTKPEHRHLSVMACESLMAKMRRKIGQDHPEFLEKHTYMTGHIKYRIGWHSCRRWFETRIWDRYKDKMQLRDIMRYSHSKVVDCYIDPYQVWKEEGKILDNTFSGLFDRFNNASKGQTKLQSYGFKF